MKRISLRQAKAGMVLAQPVINAVGTVMAGEGITLSEAMLDRMVQAGIQSVAVESDGAEDVREAGRVLERLDHLFRKQGDDVFMSTLKSTLHDYFARKVEEGEKSPANP